MLSDKCYLNQLSRCRVLGRSAGDGVMNGKNFNSNELSDLETTRDKLLTRCLCKRLYKILMCSWFYLNTCLRQHRDNNKQRMVKRTRKIAHGYISRTMKRFASWWLVGCQKFNTPLLNGLVWNIEFEARGGRPDVILDHQVRFVQDAGSFMSSIVLELKLILENLYL